MFVPPKEAGLSPFYAWCATTPAKGERVTLNGRVFLVQGVTHENVADFFWRPLPDPAPGTADFQLRPACYIEEIKLQPPQEG